MASQGSLDQLQRRGQDRQATCRRDSRKPPIRQRREHRLRERYSRNAHQTPALSQLDRQICRFLPAVCERTFSRNVIFRCPLRLGALYIRDDRFPLVMEDGGHGLFEFTQRAHAHIAKGNLEIEEWQQIVKRIFKQILSAVEFMHSLNVCHFDISAENVLINDVPISFHLNSAGKQKMYFQHSAVQLVN